MIEINGKYNTAKVFTDIVDSASVSQIIELCSQEFTKGERIRMMPDVHAGTGCVIGTTMTITDKIVPNLVGVDIGCGMETVRIKERNIEVMQLDKLIYRSIPSGFAIREKPHKFAKQIDVCELRCADKIDIRKAERSLGTLGGGNHFIEADRGEKGIYIVIHSGSRHLGLEVAKYYQQEGWRQLNKAGEAEIRELIDALKTKGREKEIRKELKKLEASRRTNVPRHLAYVSGSLFDDYIHDMKIVQEYAALSRRAMMEEIVRGMKLTVEEQFTTIHNYIDTESMILRKGSVSAREGERLIIPINMRDGSLICKGKGNPDWNYSAPHGAGRLMSRREAKESFTVSQFKKEMEGIYSTSVGRGTLDECPMAYKSIEDIADNIGETAETEDIIRLIYNFKAGAQEERDA